MRIAKRMTWLLALALLSGGPLAQDQAEERQKQPEQVDALGRCLTEAGERYARCAEKRPDELDECSTEYEERRARCYEL